MSIKFHFQYIMLFSNNQHISLSIYELAIYKNVAPDSKAAQEFTKLDKQVQQTLADMFVKMSMEAGEKLSTIQEAGMLESESTDNKKPAKTFANGQNAKGEFIANVLFDLADTDWFTGGYNYAILSMSKTDDTEFRNFYKEIYKRTKGLEDYENNKQPSQKDTFTIRDGKNKSYIYVVDLDGYLHGVVLEKIDANKYNQAIQQQRGGNSHGRTNANIGGRIRNARLGVGSAGANNSRAVASGSNSGHGGVGQQQSQSNLAGNNGGKSSANQKISSVTNKIQRKMPVQDSAGRALSEGQQEFFEESKARNNNGQLVSLYHGTENGGFTVFDPSFSDDGISLFMTDNP